MPQIPHPDILCGWCDIPFHPRNKTQLYCSRRCYQNNRSHICATRADKVCPGCNRLKSIDEFAIASNRADGHQSNCKACGVIARQTTQRSSDLKRAFGISADQYDVILEYQDGVCAICSEVCKTNRRLSVDHDHRNLKVRGLLCANCNKALGGLQDDPELLRLAIAYLENPPAHDILYQELS